MNLLFNLTHHGGLSSCALRFRRCCRGLFVVAAGFLSVHMPCALAQQADDIGSARERYAAGSIVSIGAADAALADADRARAEIETRYTAEQQACYPKFFTTSCIDTAKERRHQALMTVHRIELEANEFKRRERMLERDKAAAEREAKAESDRLSRVRPSQVSDSGTPLAAQTEVESEEQAARSFDRIAQHEAKLKRLQDKDAAHAEQRARNVANYEKKLRASQERQNKLAQKKAQKEEQRRARQASEQATQ
jgi:hypothetical protein